MSRPWSIMGANGQIGKALASALSHRDAIFWGRDEADLADAEALRSLLAATPCSAIINAAAYTAVDKAEGEESLAHAVNGTAPGILASHCAAAHIPFVHYSTDYVFDGSGNQPRREDAPTSPLNAYGRSKLAGEAAVQAAGGRFLIFRTSWVYDEDGKNFLNTMLRLGAERETLNIVADQIGAPSYALHLAQASIHALDAAMTCDSFPSGIYHLCHAGETSWHGFAEAIFMQARTRGLPVKVRELTPIASGEYPTPARRPLNSRLDCSKLARELGVTLPDWQEGLALCMTQKMERIAA